MKRLHRARATETRPRHGGTAAAVAVAAAALLLAASADLGAQVQVFTDEGAYRAALASAGLTPLEEGFEGTAWDAVRSSVAGGSHTAATVPSQGVTWSASSAVTTNDVAPRSGTWRGYDHPGGAPDTLSGASPVPLRAVGGWFVTNTPPATLRLLVDGAAPDAAHIQLSNGYRFLGIVSSTGFATFDFLGDGSAGDEKHWFVDDVTLGLDNSPRPTGAVPGVAAMAGLRNSDWHSDLWIHNHGSATASVELSLSTAGTGPTSSSSYLVDVAAGETRAIRDVVHTAFALDGASGALLYRVTDGDPGTLVLRADTYNRLNQHERYGQSIPAVSFADLPPSGAVLVLPGVADPHQYRYNLGLVSGGARSALVRVIDGLGGGLLHTAMVDLPAYGWLQVVDLQRAYSLGEASDWYLEVVGVDGPVLATASLIDQQSNDGVTFVARPMEAGGASLWLPGAARLGGRLGSTWRSDLFSVNPDATSSRIEVAFFPRATSHPGGVPFVTATAELGAHRQSSRSDVLGAMLQLPEGSAGALLVTQDRLRPLVHVLRTYNDTLGPQGQRMTYGSATPAVPVDALLADGEDGCVAGVQHDSDTRANLTLTNAHFAADGSPLATTVDLELLAPSGAPLARQSLVLEPLENIQVDRFPEALLGAGADLRDATLVVRVGGFAPGDSGGVLPMVSLVNGNRTPGVGTSDPQSIVAVNRSAVP